MVVGASTPSRSPSRRANRVLCKPCSTGTAMPRSVARDSAATTSAARTRPPSDDAPCGTVPPYRAAQGYCALDKLEFVLPEEPNSSMCGPGTVSVLCGRGRRRLGADSHVGGDGANPVRRLLTAQQRGRTLGQAFGLLWPD